MARYILVRYSGSTHEIPVSDDLTESETTALATSLLPDDAEIVSGVEN